MTDVQISTAFAFRMLGIPYIWAGQSLDGVDCSGCLQLVLAASGHDPRNDQSAQALFDAFKSKCVTTPCEGAVVFYGKDTKHIVHVCYCISNARMIGACGGDSTCTTVAIARAKNAEVKIGLINYRTDIVAYVYPFV